MQIPDKPRTWSEFERISSIRDHGKSYIITPDDGGQDKLRNRRHVKPMEPKTYELIGSDGLSCNLPDSRPHFEAPATCSSSAEDPEEAVRSAQMQSVPAFKELAAIASPREETQPDTGCEEKMRSNVRFKKLAAAMGDQCPAANPRSRTRRD